VFNLAYARSTGGKFILRIEDTDRERSRPDSEARIMRSLHWLKLDYDEGPDVGGPYAPYRQSERRDIYVEFVQRLIDTGKAYRCFCTKERLDELRERQKANKERLGYDGFCRSIDPQEAERQARNGETHVVRLAVPREGNTAFRDEIRDEEIVFDNREIDDQVLLKSDQWPTYHLASVVDDHLMKVSDVIRAEEWITSTPKHVLLYQSFGWPMPRFFHMPLLRNPDKSKISKRKNPTSLDWYREQGYLRETLVNFLALLGWSIGGDREKFSFEEMVREFRWDRVKTSEPIFDFQKLDWLNGLYLRELPAPELRERLLEGGFTDSGKLDRVQPVLPQIQERMKKLNEFDAVAGFFFAEGLNYEANLLIPKKKDAGFAREALARARTALEGIDPWETQRLEAAMRTVCEQTGWAARDLFMPIRVAVSGSTASPPLFESMAVLGKAACLKRLDEAIVRLSGDAV
jgi:glutamyl-tRNA synthetase